MAAITAAPMVSLSGEAMSCRLSMAMLERISRSLSRWKRRSMSASPLKALITRMPESVSSTRASRSALFSCTRALLRFRLLLMRAMSRPLTGSNRSEISVSCGDSVSMVARKSSTAMGSRNTISM